MKIFNVDYILTFTMRAKNASEAVEKVREELEVMSRSTSTLTGIKPDKFKEIKI